MEAFACPKITEENFWIFDLHEVLCALISQCLASSRLSIFTWWSAALSDVSHSVCQTMKLVKTESCSKIKKCYFNKTYPAIHPLQELQMGQLSNATSHPGFPVFNLKQSSVNNHFKDIERPLSQLIINGQNKWNTQISIAPIRIFLH